MDRKEWNLLQVYMTCIYDMLLFFVVSSWLILTLSEVQGTKTQDSNNMLLVLGHISSLTCEIGTNK